MDISLARAYDPVVPGAGSRILVDWIWPRGLSKEAVQIDLWLKEVAPSTELRKWFGHDPAKWDEFRRRYFAELDENEEAVSRLREAVSRGPIVLVYSAKDTDHNQAVALKEYLERRPA